METRKIEFTLFEKIFYTLGIISGCLFCIGIFFVTFSEDLCKTIDFHTPGEKLSLPFMAWLVTALLLLIIGEVILNRIWGLSLKIFPFIFDREE